MSEQEKSSLSRIADAAHTAKSAAEIAKALSSAAKGGAAGGPLGAVAGLAYGSRKQIGKIIAAGAVLLMLPVLFILMLPSVIFGGLTSAGEGENSIILNDNPAIIENMNTLSFAINGVLGEGIDNVLARIEQDFSATNGDQYEVINPYEGNIVSNANQFLSQYCAAKEQDWKSISIDDLKQVLENGMSQMYSFSRTSESREVTVAGEDGEETRKTEKWYIYTIVYNGEGYFADAVFHLTDEQKGLSQSYAENLSTFLGDGIFQGPSSSGPSSSIPSLGDIRFTDGASELVYYNQKDARYANAPFGTDNVGSYGCGPSAMAIVVSSLTNDMMDPAEMAQWAYKHGYWCSKSGSYHTLIPGAAKAWGLAVEGCTASEPQRIVDALSSGKLVVALMTKGHFTSSGHFIVLRGVRDGQILVADPNSYERSQKAWDLSIILNEASKRAGAGGPFWIIGAGNASQQIT